MSADQRIVVTGIGAAGLGLAVSACGGGSTSSSDVKTVSGSSVAAADVPVGGAVLLSDVSVLVTQPTEGTFKAFSSVCTHQGCTVSSLKEGHLLCPCHNSQFDLATGQPTAGPATAALPSKRATRAGDKIEVS